MYQPDVQAIPSMHDAAVQCDLPSIADASVQCDLSTLMVTSSLMNLVLNLKLKTFLTHHFHVHDKKLSHWE